MTVDRGYSVELLDVDKAARTVTLATPARWPGEHALEDVCRIVREQTSTSARHALAVMRARQWTFPHPDEPTVAVRVRRLRVPYTGAGATGAIASACIDLEELDTLPAADRRRAGLEESARGWLEQAFALDPVGPWSPRAVAAAVALSVPRSPAPVTS